MTVDKAGRIVWHDLFTTDRQRAMAFYKRVAGWNYKTERATDFAWGGGEQDFVLALSGDEAGAGFVEVPPELRRGWVAYVEVHDVDATAAHAAKLGGTIVRQPFEVPGVGRNALLRDPLGALVGTSLSRHNFPAPQRQFGVEVYLSDATTFPEAFYAQLFNWKLASLGLEPLGAAAVVGPSGEDVAVHLSAKPPNGEQAIWIPSLRVHHAETALRDAEELGAISFSNVPSESAQQYSALLRDPDGASLCLQTA